ncbi:squalene--hopene cyclase [Paenibacillus marchantiophytorum]|uniref:Squalene--hopene cyclase n=1 Tax=Paenibacillus marchantiophytorum TaxID=1619310 RepID=A0ABQ1ENI6_9BACL|nr:squalene--hopene cyclase [Paenibacillus marchantiophytorum]GFZ79607.1 squalene--hopene cyclase [Paenibacillus marchantiophytorum]
MPVWRDVAAEIHRMTGMLERVQKEDGSWRFCFENGILTDAYLIIVLRTLEQPQETLIRQLHDRIRSQQEANGAWKVYQDEEDGNLDATVDAYYALLYSGYSQKTDEPMLKAARFILSKGGLQQVKTVLTHAFLAATGQSPWPTSLKIPPEFLLLPPSSPISFFDFSGYARVHFTPILIMANLGFSKRNAAAPDLSDLYTRNDWASVERHNAEWEDLTSTRTLKELLRTIQSGLKELSGLPWLLRDRGMQYAEQYMLKRIEADGTLYSYSSCTLLMIMALLALGYDKQHPVITNAISGLSAILWNLNGHVHLQNSPSTVWDTALLSYALQQAGTSPNHPSIRKSLEYLLRVQHTQLGDWSFHVSHPLPGGWGFSESNSINPDVDDSTAALRAIRGLSLVDPEYRDAWNRGLNWVLSMQNKDGGWPAFEKGVTNKLLTLFPIDGAADAAIDPSTADLTGRTLEFLGTTAGLDRKHALIGRGADWLLSNQEANGSWYGRWGICYIYGTWSALTGLAAVGFGADHPSIRNGVQWLLSIQNADGGWGESCTSDRSKRYVPLGASTPSQTAWALDALIAVSPAPSPEIDKGIERLLSLLHLDDWTTRYPTGSGLPGCLYTDYHSYRYIWPLLTLNQYHNKYTKETSRKLLRTQ